MICEIKFIHKASIISNYIIEKIGNTFYKASFFTFFILCRTIFTSDIYITVIFILWLCQKKTKTKKKLLIFSYDNYGVWIEAKS